MIEQWEVTTVELIVKNNCVHCQGSGSMYLCDDEYGTCIDCLEYESIPNLELFASQTLAENWLEKQLMLDILADIYIKYDIEDVTPYESANTGQHGTSKLRELLNLPPLNEIVAKKWIEDIISNKHYGEEA